jgi:hypothetical protein
VAHHASAQHSYGPDFLQLQGCQWAAGRHV